MLPEILAVFEETLKPKVDNSKANLGEQIDTLLGFSSITAASDPQNDFPSSRPDSWRLALANYRSSTEYRLQALCESIWNFVFRKMGIADLPPLDSICVRIVEDKYSSPSTRGDSGFHYILVPSGFLKSIENLWRVHFALAEHGEGLPSKPGLVKSNRIGGAMVERCLSLDFRGSLSYLHSLFFDTGWHRWYDGPLTFPEQLLTAADRIAREMASGLYSSEGIPNSEIRIASNSKSQWLSRLILAYLTTHEMAHVIYRHEDICGSEVGKQEIETLCDVLATIYLPYFVEHDSRGWNPTLDHSTEHLAGTFGFFATIELREIADLILRRWIGEISEGTSAFDSLSSRIGAFQKRAVSQATYLLDLTSEDRELRVFTERLRTEFRALHVGVQMVGSRLLNNRQTSFASHFIDWQRRL